jgi:C4-dicarboxylate-specific signal transduction histidine kinase
VFALQVFVFLTAIPVLCIAAVSTSRDRVVHLHRALLASLQDHVAVIDARGIILEVNAAWRRFAETSSVLAFERGHTGHDYAGACRRDAATGDATACRALAGVERVLNRERRRFEMEYEHERHGHRTRFVFSVEALEQAEGGAVVTRADVTERHRALMDIEEQRRALSHLARVTVLGQLSGALAHELNQPLASIAGNADAARLLLKREPPDLEELDLILQDIVTSNQRAAQVIQRLRALLNRGETRQQLITPAELVNDVLELAHAELITRRVIATALVVPDISPVFGDRVQLQQVLLNLVLNACESMTSVPPADRRLSVMVSADARDNVHFSVRDCGTGIPATLIDRLFEPFVTTKSEGMGLGLSISRTIIAAHGGRMWAENNFDRGATFHCLLSSASLAPSTVAMLRGKPANLSLVSSDVA